MMRWFRRGPGSKAGAAKSANPEQAPTDEPSAPLPSLPLIADRVSSGLSEITSHGESLDARAGVALGFAGVLVGLSATAQLTVTHTDVFRSGLVVAGVSGAFAAAAFFPRKFPVLTARYLRSQYLGRPEASTQLVLLDTEVDMIEQATRLSRWKARLLKVALVGLAVAVGLMVAGVELAGHG